jgi:hypothetical protein
MERLQRAKWVLPKPTEFISACMRHGMTRTQAKAMYRMDRGESWRNDIYVVALKRPKNITPFDGFVLEKGYVWLSIRRDDRKPIFDWRDMQEIKNQLVGPECEGIQLFPAESRLVDTSNQFHIICAEDPGAQFPMGYTDRVVNYDDADFCKAVQRTKEDA